MLLLITYVSSIFNYILINNSLFGFKTYKYSKPRKLLIFYSIPCIVQNRPTPIFNQQFHR